MGARVLRSSLAAGEAVLDLSVERARLCVRQGYPMLPLRFPTRRTTLHQPFAGKGQSPLAEGPPALKGNREWLLSVPLFVGGRNYAGPCPLSRALRDVDAASTYERIPRSFKAARLRQFRDPAPGALGPDRLEPSPMSPVTSLFRCVFEFVFLPAVPEAL